MSLVNLEWVGIYGDQFPTLGGLALIEAGLVLYVGIGAECASVTSVDIITRVNGWKIQTNILLINAVIPSSVLIHTK